MKQKVVGLLVFVLGLSVPVSSQSLLVPNGNKLTVNASADHTLALLAEYRVRMVNQGAATATVKTWAIGKPNTASATDLRFYVCSASATTCAASATTVKLTEGFCDGLTGKYGFVVDVVLSTGAVIAGPLSSKGIDCGTVAASSVSDVSRVQ